MHDMIADLFCPQVHFSDNKPVQFCSREWKEVYNLIDSSEKFITPKMTLQTPHYSWLNINDKKEQQNSRSVQPHQLNTNKFRLHKHQTTIQNKTRQRMPNSVYDQLGHSPSFQALNPQVDKSSLQHVAIVMPDLNSFLPATQHHHLLANTK